MKIYIMTDMEGVCGIVDHDQWVIPQGRYYEAGKRLLTNEVNAAIEGFCMAGADEIMVADGHGAGGIDNLMLDPRAKYLRMMPGIFPFMLDESFDGMAHIGQHAKAGSEFAHLPHTGMFNLLNEEVNGVSIGEFGQMTICAADLGVPSFFASGDHAFKLEAEALVPGIECVEVKWGTTPGKGDECTFEEYKERNLSAIHLHPDEACKRIKEAAYAAAVRLKNDPTSFSFPAIKAPYHRIIQYRASVNNEAYTTTSSAQSMVELLNGSW